MKHTRAMLVLVCALALPGRAPADDFGDMFSVMFRMMLTMMNVMSSAMDNDGWGNNWGGSNWNNWGNWGALSGMSPWSGMGGWPGMSPWSGMGGWPGMSPWSGMGGWPGMSPWSGMGSLPLNGAMSPWSGLPGGDAWGVPFAGVPYAGTYSPARMSGYGLPGGWDGGPGVSLLDGRWYGSSGEILEIRGDSFRLQNAVTSLNGSIRITDNVINLFSPQTGTMTQYSFVGNGNDLLLQDAAGQVISFHKNPIKSSLNVF